MSLDNKEDLINLKRELLETKYRLYTFENSRSAKLARYLKQFMKNPFKGLATLHELPEVLKKAVVPKPDLTQVSDPTQTPPLPIKGNNPLLLYPHIKVACLGSIEDVADVCHAFEMGDINWVNLLERGIDIAIVTDIEYTANSAAKKWIETVKSNSIPLVVIKTASEALPQILKTAELIMDRTDKHSKEIIKDKPFTNIFADNPINWKMVPEGKIGLYNVFSEPSELISSAKIELLSNESKPTNQIAIIASDKELDSFQNFNSLLSFSASGIPVFVHGGSEARSTPFDHYNTIEDALAAAEELISDLEKRERISIRQRRSTILGFSQLERFEFILRSLDIPLREPPTISAIVSTKRPEFIDQVLSSFTFQSYPHKELIMILHGDNFDSGKIKKKLKESGVAYKLIQKPEATLFGDNLNTAVEDASGDFITKMDDDDYYGESHFLDLLAAYRYSRANMVGKWSNWVYLKNKDKTTTWVIENQETYTHHLPGGTFLTEREFIRKTRFGRVRNAIDSELYRRIEARGAILYTTHRYNYTRVRHGDHTYKAVDEVFLSRCSAPEFKGLDETRTSA